MAMFAGRSRLIRALGTLTAVATFIAPYVYFGLYGRDYPPYVIVVIAALVLSGVGFEVWKAYREKRLARRYARGAAERLAISS